MKIHHFGDLDSFGELALTTEKPRTATLITMKDCSLISITKENFKVNGNMKYFFLEYFKKLNKKYRR